MVNFITTTKNISKDSNIENSRFENEGKSFILEIYIRTLNNRIWKYLTNIGQIGYNGTDGYIVSD